MMATEDKTLFCFCHWGRKNKVLPDGSILYVEGITRQLIVKTGIKYNDFVNTVFDQLCIDPSDKILHFTVKFDRSELIQLSDQEDVNTLLRFNDGFAHVYASSLEKGPYSRLSSAGDSKPQQREAVGSDHQKHAGVTRSRSNPGENLNQNGVGLHEGTANQKASGLPSGGAKKVELTVDSDSEADTVTDSYLPEVYHYPDAEFSDFDEHRAQDCFEMDQIWACFDAADGMPRFYAHIRKVEIPEFKVTFSWLEAHPEDQRGTAWARAELPVGCGKFRRGSKEFTFDRLIFSLQMQCEMDKRGVYIIYPRKGETWALFKDWDISWSSDPDNHSKYKYEIVEILSDYVVDVGVQVCYLDKVTRFVSLFQQTRPTTEVSTFFIKPNELYKFSHRIPSSKMTGSEQEGVPAGSFELHPICLPHNPDDVWYPGKVKEDSRTTHFEPVENVLHATASLKSGDLNGIHATDRESVKAQVSPKEMNPSEKKRTQMSFNYANDGDFDDSCVKKSRQSSPGIPIHLSCEADSELYSRTKNFDLDNSFEEFSFDFKIDRCMGKFQVNQVWAVYGENNTLPRTYVLVKKIVSAPFKLHVVLLEVCAGPKNAAQSVCGTFKVQNEKRQVYAPSSFSHVVKAVSINGNMFEIYPREREIWALYKSLKKSGLDSDKFEYEIVEVIENSKDHRIQVSSMVRVNGFKSVFIRSNSVILGITEDEFWRFSHQIPAFQLTGENGRVLRGCWELDPASVPCSM